MGTAGERQRKFYIDILRILACLLVIYNHSECFERFAVGGLPLPDTVAGTALAMTCKCAVPLFFMISGALLLPKQESLGRTLRRMPKILLDWALFSLLYYQVHARSNGGTLTLRETLDRLLAADFWHLWYLYAYLVFLLTLPFLRRFVQGLDKPGAVYLLVLMVLVQYGKAFLPARWVVGDWFTADILMYPVAGYILDRLLPVEAVRPRHIGALWAGAALFYMVNGWLEHQFLMQHPGDTADTLLVNFTLYLAMAVFVTAKYLLTQKVRPGAKAGAVTAEIADCTFGIYLLHLLFYYYIPPFVRLWGEVRGIAFLAPYGGAFLACLGTFAVSGAVTFLLRRIPLLQKLF